MVGSTWPKRSTTLRAPNFGAQLAHTAPSGEVGDQCFGDVGQVGRHTIATPDTASGQPGAGPRSTRSSSCAHGTRTSSRVCEWAIEATSWGAPSARRSACSA
jgi:hypothetical protein